MKLQYLIIIFLLIMTPIYLVFSRYIDVQMEKINIQNTYDVRLREATYDAVKAFQTNTINSFLYVPETRVKFSKASVNSFFTSLNLAFGYNGESKTLMNGYVPAVVLTMYDGYYIYSPFVNTLINVDEEVDEDYENKTTLTDLKPYITYTCRYKKGSTDYIITYSLDNYIIVDEFNGSMHKRHEGYLIGLDQYTDVQGTVNYDNPESITSLKFNGIEFSNNTKERLREYLIDENGEGKFFYYTIKNGTKYYYGTTDENGKVTNTPGDINAELADDNTTDVIFYIDDSGVRMKQIGNYKDNKESFLYYYNSIKENTLAFEYYRDAYVFTNWVKENLDGITKNNIVTTENYDGYEFTDVGNIFGDIDSNNSYIEDLDSSFNRHRKEVIRAVIQTNLSAAISGFSTYSQAEENIQFIMPKISEENWDLLENNVCIATFLQGFPIGNKTYNGYAVVPNTKTKELVDAKDIYLLKTDNTYAKINEQGLSTSLKSNTSGVWRINFEIKNLKGKTYIPTSYYNEENKITAYLESYNSMMGTNLDTYTDIYKYLRNTTPNVRRAYYIGLGRERKGTFRFTNYKD